MKLDVEMANVWTRLLQYKTKCWSTAKSWMRTLQYKTEYWKRSTRIDDANSKTNLSVVSGA